MSNLFGSDESDHEEVVLKTNADYAKSYNQFRQKELKQKLKDRGFESDSDNSEDSSSDDDEVSDNPEFDEVFFKTLASLKSKDPKIYNKDVNFFGKFDSKETIKSSKKTTKPFTVKDMERDVILNKNGLFEDDEVPNNGARSASPSLVEKERQIKEELQRAMEENSEDESNEWGGLFKKRQQDQRTAETEEKQYALWLAGQSQSIKKDDEEILGSLKSYWSNSKLSKDEKFLRDYLLKGKYKEPTSMNSKYNEEEEVNLDVQLSEDEKDIDQQEEFEKKYNFRYEEPDKDFLKSYPRTIDWSVRAEDDRRKKKRAEIKDRKEKEKEQRRQDLQVLKEIKRQEIQEKIDKLKLVTGNEDLPINDDFLDQDFDPDEHDKKMQAIFNDEYYRIDEGEQKPECPDDIDDLKVEDWDNYDPKEDNANDASNANEDGLNEDCDFDPQQSKADFQQDIIDSTRGRKKRRRKSKFAETIQKTKPVFNPEDEKTYAEYIDEYYKMDYEDMIGNIPCRFKYVQTVPNDFGLSVEEILLAKNKELNQWASLKKSVQIRPEHIEKNEVRQYQMRAKNLNIKKKILKSLFTEGSDSDDDDEATPKKKKKPAEQTAVTSNQPKTEGNLGKTKNVEDYKTKQDPPLQPTAPAKNKKKKNKKSISTNSYPGPVNPKMLPQKSKSHLEFKAKSFKNKSKNDSKNISDNRLRALGLNPEKYYSTLKYGKDNKDPSNVKSKMSQKNHRHGKTM